jgi:outer membrane biosynthesis protein TonB
MYPLSSVVLAGITPLLIASAGAVPVPISALEIGNGRYTVMVPPGYGVVLDLSSVGQRVTGAGFGDATKFIISGLDGNLCYLQERCKSTGAGIIQIRSITLPKLAKDASFPAQTYSSDGGTSLTLITDGKLGRKILHVRVVAVPRPQYTALLVENAAPVQRLALSPGNTPLPSLPALSVTRAPVARPVSRPLPPPPVVRVAPEPAPVATVIPTPIPAAIPTPSPTATAVATPARSPELVRDHQQRPQKHQSKKTTPIQSPPTIAIAKPPITPTPDTTSASTPPTTPTATRTLSPTHPTSFRGYSAKQMATFADAHALRRGMNQAITLKLLPYNSYQYYRGQTAISLLMQGRSRAQAASLSGLPLTLIEQWIKLGQS